MRTSIVEISLEELQEALRNYCNNYAVGRPDVVHVVSYDKVVIRVDLYPKGCVQATEFRHRLSD